EKICHNGIIVYRRKINPNNIRNNFAKFISKHKYDPALDWINQSWIFNQKIRKINQDIEIDLIQYASYTGTCYYRQNNIPSVVRISSYEPIYQSARKEN